MARVWPPRLGPEIALTGSVARGWADGYSDTEIVCWVEELPDDMDWQSCLEGLGVEVAQAYGPEYGELDVSAARASVAESPARHMGPSNRETGRAIGVQLEPDPSS